MPTRIMTDTLIRIGVISHTVKYKRGEFRLEEKKYKKIQLRIVRKSKP